LGAPRSSAKHKIVKFAAVRELIGPEKARKRVIVAVDLARKRTRRIFHLSTTRRAVYCPAALESRGRAASPSFAPTCV
jgi:hypothetical protein